MEAFLAWLAGKPVVQPPILTGPDVGESHVTVFLQGLGWGLLKGRAKVSACFEQHSAPIETA
jgi:hypothetical protein